MPYALNAQEHAAVAALPGPARYAHFVKRVADWEEVWSLRNAAGFVLSADDAEQPAAPVWPHPAYAQDCATGAWAACEPVAIPLEQWLDRWLPGLERDGRGVAVFLLPSGAGVVVPPARLAADLAAELDAYE